MPNLRSSMGPTTPSAKSNSATPSPSSSSGRKVPMCKTCGRPRKGHPRQSCDRESATPEPEIAGALSALRIQPEERRRRSRAPPMQPEPGMMDDQVDEDSEEYRATMARWQERIATPTKVKDRKSHSRTPMPGTLQTPNSSFFHSTQSTELEDAPEEKKALLDEEDAASDGTQTQAQHFVAVEKRRTARPLMRTMSAEERIMFLDNLSAQSTAQPACMFNVPTEVVPSAQEAAVKVGYHTLVVDIPGPTSQVIVGRDASAVRQLHTSLSATPGSDPAAARRGGALQAVAGGAVVGAVATFTGLAFS